MFKLRVESEFSAAHFLQHYRGKCENLHGHNYKVRLWVSGNSIDDSGMLADFALLKKALKEVLAVLDHGNLNEIDYFNHNPSAERIARYIFEKTKEKFSDLGIEKSLLSAVDVFETPPNMARYTEKG